MSNLLLVEDDPQITESLIRILPQLGHTVSALSTAGPAMAAVIGTPPDLVLLDLGLPDMDGSTLLMMLRAVCSVPVIVITARTEEDEAIRLLDLGADDYVTKPFSVAHLNARIRAVLRRSELVGDPVIRVGGLSVDPARGEVRLDGELLALRRRDYDVLLVLTRRAGQFVSRAEIIEEIWGAAGDDAQGRLDVHLSFIRAALGESARTARYLQTRRGVGVRLAAPETTQ